MTDRMTTPKAESEAGQLFIDQDGDVCITGRENNLIFCPATDDGDGVPDWTVLNPDVVQEIVRRWNEYPALLARAEAAEADAASEREVSRENFNQLFLARKALTAAQASIGAAWCEGRDAMMPTVNANCRICGGSGYSGGSGGTGKAMTVMYPCGHGVAALTPPPDAAAALQRAKDEAWNAAVDACAVKCRENGMSSMAGEKAIRALRKEG